MAQTGLTGAEEYQAFLYQVGENVRHYRKLCFGNQEELSANVGMNVCTISRIESGMSNPKIETVFLLAKALGVEPVELLKKPEKENCGNLKDFLNVPGYGELSNEQKAIVRDVAILMTNRLAGKILLTSQENK